MATTTRPDLTAELVALQDEIRSDFGWDVKDDLASAFALKDAWPRTKRPLTLLRIQERLMLAPITVLGAAVEVEDVYKALQDGHHIIAADGAIGVLSELESFFIAEAWSRIICVVSDADGAPEHLDEAARRGIPFVLHAHGDNRRAWGQFLNRLEDVDLQLVLSHQTPNPLAGMINPGGFTDGDRAVCLALHLGVAPDSIHLAGFRTDRIGRWTGATHPERKVRKLIWMARILDRVGVKM